MRKPLCNCPAVWSVLPRCSRLGCLVLVQAGQQVAKERELESHEGLGDSAHMKAFVGSAMDSVTSRIWWGNANIRVWAASVEREHA